MTSATMPMRMKGYTFTLSAPYAEGHRLTSAEAQALNDLRAENIGNNFRSRVNEQVARLAPGELLAQHVLDGLTAELAGYDAGYQFASKTTRTKIGDIEREIQAVAKERAIAQAEAPSQVEGLIEQFVGLPAVLEEARSRVAARRSALAGGMDSL